MNRRTFLHQSGQLAALIALVPWQMPPLLPSDKQTAFPRLADLHALFPDPLPIREISWWAWEGKWLLRVRTDQHTGHVMANTRMPHLRSLFEGLIGPFFLGKDARDLATLVEDVYRTERLYKYAGMPFSNCVGHLELALLDLLGQAANRPAYRFFGEPVRTQIPVYLSSLTRENTAEAEVAFLQEKQALSGARGIKLKIGGRMTAQEPVPGRTAAIVPLARRTFGDDFALYADANGSYTAPQAIEVGQMLVDHGVGMLEEPCAWEDVRSNQQVTQTLKGLYVAGGKQDTSLLRWQYLVEERVYTRFQPDLFYNGGMIRALAVAEMAHRAGLDIAPHTPKANPLAGPFLQLAAVCPNLQGLQEYPAKEVGKAAPSWFTPHLTVAEGHLSLPQGPGLGIAYDPDIWKKAQRL